MQRKSGTPPRKKPAVILPGVVAPPRGSPFLGISGTDAPARNTHLPHLSERVALAEANRQRLQQGGLLTPEQQAREKKAARVIAKAPAPKTSTAAPKSGDERLKASGPRSQVTTRPQPTTLPAWLTKPAVQLDGPNSTPAPNPPTPPTGRRGAPAGAHPAQPTRNFAPTPTKSSFLGDLQNVASLGLGTALQAANTVPSTLLTPIHPGSTRTDAEGIKPTHLSPALADTAARANTAAARVAKLGVSGGIPTHFSIPSIDLVAPAGAATVKGAITAAEFKKLNEQGYDLSPRLDKRFTKMALDNGWNPAELDGISGSAKIDKAFSKPAALPLRVLGNFGSGVAKLGTLPAGIEGAVRETAAGNGLDVAQALGEGLYSELPIVGKHKATDTAVADPFGFITQFAGAGKTIGAVGKLSRFGKATEEAERVVQSANSGLEIHRGARDANAYNATGQMIRDAATRRVPALGRKAEGGVVDESVWQTANKIAPDYVNARTTYLDALHKVKPNRAEELLAYQQAGHDPKRIADFYRANGNPDNAKFYDRVAASTEKLSDDDQAFLNAHADLARHTTQSNIDRGKFGDTAAKFRRYSQLIRSSAHLGDPNAQRVLGLREDYSKALDNAATPEDIAALEGAYTHAVDEFAAQHAAAGGAEPAYVAYSKAKPLVSSPFKPGTGSKTAFKDVRGRQKAETGATFESGKFLVDAHSPLIDSIRAQREHVASALKQEVADAVGKKASAGDVVPPGHVFVSETNLRAIRRTTSDMEDNPVSSRDYYDEDHSFRQSLHDALSKNTTPTGHRVPRGEKGYFIPSGAHRRMLDHTRPQSRAKYDQLMSQYQRVLVSYRPSTIVNNAVGSPILAATFGAGPKSFLKAWQSGPGGDPSLSAPVLSGRGVAGGLVPQSESKIGQGFDRMRSVSARAEDFSRRAAAFAKILPGSDKRAKELGYDDTNAYLRDVAVGKVDEARLKAGFDNASAALGDALKPDTDLARKLGRGILFHRWIAHMAKVLLYTLPVEHPRRLAVLLDLSNYGDQYRQEHGVWPDWYREYLPLFQSVKRLGHAGKPQTFTTTFSTTGLNPYSSLNNFADPVSTANFGSEPISNAARDLLLGVSAPPISIIGKTLFDRPADSHDALRYLAGQTFRQFPGVSVVRPQGGMGPDSIPFFAEERKRYAGTRPGSTLPWDFRPGARPLPGLLGGLIRYGLGGVYEVPAQGPVHNNEQRKHIGAAAKAARKRRKG